MKEVDIATIAGDFKGFLQQAKPGETVLIFDQHRLLAELRPVPAPPLRERPMGTCKGMFVVPDDFDDPLPDDVIATFYPEDDDLM